MMTPEKMLDELKNAINKIGEKHKKDKADERDIYKRNATIMNEKRALYATYGKEKGHIYFLEHLVQALEARVEALEEK